VSEEDEDFRGQGARRNVAEQIGNLLIESGFSGSKGVVAERLKKVLEAERRDEPRVLRAAVMELAVAAGAWVASIDLALGPEESPRRRRRSAATYNGIREGEL
jgi:hypothetical protein